MIITILDWIGTLFVFIGAFLITSKKATNPKIRMLGLSAYLMNTMFWIPMTLMLGTYGLFLSQVFLFIINLKGIRNCLKEMKKENEYNIFDVDISNDYFDSWEDIMNEEYDNEY